MFTINVKGYRNPRDLEMVKLKLIFFKTGYARVPKLSRYPGGMMIGTLNDSCLTEIQRIYMSAISLS